jgi:hypothetical protein
MIPKGRPAGTPFDALANGPTPRTDGWAWLYDAFGVMAPPGSGRRRFVCRYFAPSRPELAGNARLFRLLGVGVFGRFIPTGGIAVRRATGAAMKPYTLHRRSLQGARDFYYRTCVFEALHLPFFLALVALATHRFATGRVDHALQEASMNIVVNLYPMLHHRHTRTRIFRILRRAAVGQAAVRR